MNELRMDFWDAVGHWRCIPTNGNVNKAGRATMGAGLAKQATKRFPGIDLLLGKAIRINGNIVQAIAQYDQKPGIIALANGAPKMCGLVAFPVKHHWSEAADLSLIESSCKQLLDMANSMQDKMMGCRIILPRVGCGNGGRDWITEVKPILEMYFDERFWIVDHQTGTEKP